MSETSSSIARMASSAFARLSALGIRSDPSIDSRRRSNCFHRLWMDSRLPLSRVNSCSFPASYSLVRAVRTILPVETLVLLPSARENL